ncbi:MAG TPA: hypothetical protein VEI02_04065 [Planctomycetota bacterium]|nr:hypothetical protein [Planctomycetota bacterium]
MHLFLGPRGPRNFRRVFWWVVVAPQILIALMAAAFLLSYEGPLP